MNKIKILIVDDVSQTRKDMTRLLYFEDDMAVVGEAGNGVEALQKIAEVQPDVILMDINMPQMDGIAATERVSQLYPNVAVVIISIQGESEYLKKAMFAGARDYLVKPLGSDEMASAIRSVYKQHRLRTAHLTQTYQKPPDVPENSYNVLNTPGIEQSVTMQQAQTPAGYLVAEENNQPIRQQGPFQQTEQQPWEEPHRVTTTAQNNTAVSGDFIRLNGEHQMNPSGYPGIEAIENRETPLYSEPEPRHDSTQPVQSMQRVETWAGTDKGEILHVQQTPETVQNPVVSVQYGQAPSGYMPAEAIGQPVRQEGLFQQTQQPWEQTREGSAAVQEDSALQREFTRLDGEHQTDPSGYAGNGNKHNEQTARYPEPETRHAEPMQFKQRVETQGGAGIEEAPQGKSNIYEIPGTGQNPVASMQHSQPPAGYMAVEAVEENPPAEKPDQDQTVLQNGAFQQTEQQPGEQIREVNPNEHSEVKSLTEEHQMIANDNGETSPLPEPEAAIHETKQTELTEPAQLKQKVETEPGEEKEETSQGKNIEVKVKVPVSSGKAGRFEEKPDAHFTPVAAFPKIPSDEKSLGMISVVFCGKGGVGKTTLATNLAVVLSQHEKKKVALVDLDLQFGDIAVMLNLSESKTISDLVREYDDISGEALANCMIRHFTGIDILPAPMFPQDAEYVNAEHIEKVLTLLKQTYDYIIVDTAANFFDINLQAMDMAEQILIVVTRDIATIKNVKTGLNILNSLGYRDRVRLVLNRADQDLGVDISDLEKGVEMAVAHQICSDERTVVSAINKGVPAMVSHSTSEISRSIRRMGERIVTGKRLPAQEKAGKTLINRIFSL